MGCCGCSNKSSAVTAGIFGIIQSVVGLIFNAFFIDLYNTPLQNDLSRMDDKLFLAYATRNAGPVIMILLVCATVLHSIWFISSIILLVGNASKNSCCIRQWVVWTSFIIIGDILFPIVLAAATFGSFMDVVNSMNQKVQSVGRQENSFENVVSSATLNFYEYYIILLFSFCKLGLITIIVNICLNVFTNRRAYEISNPRGYVMGTTVTVIQGQAGVPGMIQVGPGTVVNQTPIVYSTGTPNPYYPGNIPLQPAVGFSPDSAPSVYPDTGSPEGVFNSLSEPLLPPKY